jgi:hypothetical protein
MSSLQDKPSNHQMKTAPFSWRQPRDYAALQEVNKLRAHPEDSQLEETLSCFFGNRLVIWSYMQPKQIGCLDEHASQETKFWVRPIEQAIDAAKFANTMVKDSWQRQAVYAASLMQPCALFLPEKVSLKFGQTYPAEHYRSMFKRKLLELPLETLSGYSSTKGRLMRYLLDQSGPGSTVPEHWEALRDAVRRGQVLLKCIW